MRKEIEPTEVVENAGTCHERTVYSHPAYAQISASRVSGSANLYASDFNHNHFMRVTISKSEHHRHLSNDWYHEKGQLIEIAMSESQWAHFISSANVGSGSQCTLQWKAGEGLIPGIADKKPITEQFSKEIKKHLEDNIDALKKLAASLNGEANIGKKVQMEMQRQLLGIAHSITDSTSFVVDQFDEHVENVVSRAKTEVNAYAMNQVVQAGLTALDVPINTMKILENK